MNAREALEKIAHSSTDFYDVCDLYQDEIDIIAKALNRLDELEAKATKKKVIFENGYYRCECGKSLEEYASDGSLNKSWWDYCPECGQALDWSE